MTETEQRLEEALANAKRNPTEDSAWLHLSLAISHLKAELKSARAAQKKAQAELKAYKAKGPSRALDDLADSVEKEAEKAVDAVEQEVARLSVVTKDLVGDIRGAFNRFRKGL